MSKKSRPWTRRQRRAIAKRTKNAQVRAGASRYADSLYRLKDALWAEAERQEREFVMRVIDVPYKFENLDTSRLLSTVHVEVMPPLWPRKK